ncbi:hypothetical protein [Limnoglobus roseus]|uniref:DUF4129 domain-containing protein n=1 Tax=Limnoglobus roseus TaxID=2598579 RepID=A0A5C1A6A6_9BACT|nr:hypothetical protein [Limnoglobus roseus]QEL13905.1 hypothetical protein PX52LOC_00763 [Limnoglobus roseus]
MTARGTLLTAVLALGLCAGTTFGQPPDRGEVTPEQIQALKQQLAALAGLPGNPEDLQKWQKFFEQWQNRGDQKGEWADFLKEHGQNPPIPKNIVPPGFDRPVPPPPGFDRPPPPPRFNGQPFQPPPPPQPGPGLPQPPREGNIDFPPPGGMGRPQNWDMNGFKPPPFDPPMGGNPDAAEFMKAWEKNVGPLNNTPAVRDAILELFAAGKDGGFGNGDWKDLLDEFNKNGNGNNKDDFGDWMKEMNFEGEKWDWGDWGGGGWDFPKWGGNNGGNWGGNHGGGGGGGWNWNWGGGGGGGGFSGGGGGTWLPVILLVVIAVGALLAWKFWPMLARRESAAEAGVRALNRWPVDPRTINSREELVKAFEYLSVLLCGDAARVWNHETIARALRQQIPHSELIADELAKLYELARYTPPGEPLSAGALADARRCLCRLAGVSA